MGSLVKTWNVCSMKFEMTSLILSIGVILVYEITKSVSLMEIAVNKKY